MIANHGFVVFSDDWGRHPSSCQHLFRRVAARNRVLWVNTVGLRTPTLGRGDLRRAAQKLREWRWGGPAASGEEERPVDVLSPPMLPSYRGRLLRRVNDRLLRRAVLRALAERREGAPILVTTIPLVAGLVGRLGEAASVYYCVDEFADWPGSDRPTLLALEAELLRAVDLVVASSQILFDAKAAAHPRVRLLRHGVDWEHFRGREGRVPAGLEALARPRVGYVGLVDARLDVPLLAATARAVPHATFVFIGPRQLPPTELDSIPNVRFLAKVAYEDLPAVLRALDIAMLPYLENRLTERMNPLKLRELLASGIPVVATPLPEVRRYERVLRAARGVGEWVEALQAAAREGRAREAERAASVREEGWDVRAEEFSRFCREAEETARGDR